MAHNSIMEQRIEEQKMANVIITSTETNLTKIVFHDMTLANAKTIADHMNTLNKLTAERTGQIIKLVFKAIGK
jgi:hypothetical protein